MTDNTQKAQGSGAVEADDGPCTDCWDTGVTTQTERRCPCQPILVKAENELWSPANDDLARLIETRLLGIPADEQDLELDDHDWRRIIATLSQPPEASDAEPVAWKCQERTMGAWHTRYVDERPTGERYRNIVPLYAHPPAADPVGLREAVEGIDDDYMTSEKHHPGYVLIPTAKFEQIVSAAERAKEIVPPYYVNWHAAADKALATTARTDDAGQPSGDVAAMREAGFQASVQPWLIACFGEMIAGDREERNHRFLEESLELVQSCGCTASEAHQLVDYVYGRPVGELHQEVGGVMVTLAALCLANDADMHAAGWVELDRIWGKVEAIRAKQAAKPKYSPLPEHVAALQKGPSQ